MGTRPQKTTLRRLRPIPRPSVVTMRAKEFTPDMATKSEREARCSADFPVSRTLGVEGFRSGVEGLGFGD